MNLQTWQEQMGNALLTLNGYGVLLDEGAWQPFTQSDQGNLLGEMDRKRLYLYEELLRGSIHSTMSSMFPHTSRFFTRHQWIKLAELYRRSHPNTSFQLFRAMATFPLFLKNWATHHVPIAPEAFQTFPFLGDLALYEWLEIQVSTWPKESLPTTMVSSTPSTVEALSLWRPVWNPAHILHHYDYTVPDVIEQMKTLSDDALKELSSIAPLPSSIVIYRDFETEKARFFKLNPLTSQLLENLGENDTYREAFERLHAQTPALQSVSLEMLLSEGLSLLARCHQNGLLVGSVPADRSADRHPPNNGKRG